MVAQQKTPDKEFMSKGDAKLLQAAVATRGQAFLVAMDKVDPEMLAAFLESCGVPKAVLDSIEAHQTAIDYLKAKYDLSDADEIHKETFEIIRAPRPDAALAEQVAKAVNSKPTPINRAARRSKT